ncbi:MAG: NDP-sugar synthase [Chlorobium sp.]
MKAFILAAGLGIRLRPLTSNIPKPLIPVLNIPSLFYTVSLLKQAGISEIICNIHHHAESIRGIVEATHLPGVQVTFSEEPVILGTGGGLKKCEKLLGDEDFILVNSDIITDIDFRALVQHHQKSGCPGTLTLYATPEAAVIGSVGVEGGQIKDFANRRHTGLYSSLIYTGTAVLSPEIFRFMTPEHSSIVDTGFTGLIDHGGLGCYEHQGLWMDIGTMQRYWQANLDRRGVIGNLAESMRLATGLSPHAISSEAIVSQDAEISGSVIGSGCRIGAESVIRNSVLLPGVEIKPGSVIINSVLDPYSVTVMAEEQQQEMPG